MRDEGVDTGAVAAGAVANVAERLRGIDFPIGKWEVLSRAEQNGADESVLETLRLLPSERTYQNPIQLFDAIGDEVRKLEARRLPPMTQTQGRIRGLLGKWRRRAP